MLTHSARTLDLDQENVQDRTQHEENHDLDYLHEVSVLAFFGQFDLDSRSVFWI
jgi:hypothetical protein